MNGTVAFLDLLQAAGVRHLFGNPGHTELPMLDVLAGRPEMDYVLGLNEAVCLAMADGYAMAGRRLGVFCSHITPGLGHAMGMLYDASRTRAPLLVVAGQQDGRFALTEPALWGDMVAMTRPLVKWAYEVARVEDLPRALRRAVKVALTPPTGPVFLSLPSHVLRGEGTFDLAPPAQIAAGARADLDALGRAAELLLRAERPMFLAGDEVGRSGAEEALRDLAELLGAAVLSEPSSNTLNFPCDHPQYVGTLPRLQKEARATLEASDLLFAVGADLFTMAVYAELDPMPEGLPLVELHADPWALGKNYPSTIALLGDPRATLEALLEEVRRRGQVPAEARAKRVAACRARRGALQETVKREVDNGAGRAPMCPIRLIDGLLDLAPADAVLVDESQTSGLRLRVSMFDRPRTYFGLKGGGLGWGLPAAVGVGFAIPDRPVLALLGDGSALYTVQGLWTAARHRRRVVFLVFNNAQYRIVKHRLHNYGGDAARHRRYLGVELDQPTVDFAALARSLGVWSHRVEGPGEVADAFRAALAQEGPALLDLAVEGSFPEREASRPAVAAARD